MLAIIGESFLSTQAGDPGKDILADVARYPSDGALLRGVEQIKLLIAQKPSRQPSSFEELAVLMEDKDVMALGIKPLKGKGMINFWLADQKVTFAPNSPIEEMIALIHDWTLPWTGITQPSKRKGRAKKAAKASRSTNFLNTLKEYQL